MENNIILYSTHCPLCKILTKKLELKNINFTEVNDTDLMIQKGFQSVPILEVDGKIMNYKEAVDWVNNL